MRRYEGEIRSHIDDYSACNRDYVTRVSCGRGLMSRQYRTREDDSSAYRIQRSIEIRHRQTAVLCLFLKKDHCRITMALIIGNIPL